MCAEMKITMENYFDRILENKKIPKQIKETVCSEMHHALEVSNMAVLISKELGKTNNSVMILQLQESCMI